jgi:serine/threonine-protein kinase
MAAPLNLSKLEMTESPVQVVQQIVADARSGVAQFAASGSGTLAYVPGRAVGAKSTLVLVSRTGKATPVGDEGDFFFPSLSPDGRRIATRRGQSIWVYDIGNKSAVRLTFDGSLNSSPIWTADGQYVIFNSDRDGPFNLFWKHADGSGREERLLGGQDTETPDSWSLDGKWLVYDVSHAGTGMDIWSLAMEGPRIARPFLQTPHDECCARLSGDGHWLAYTSNESGRYEVYVQPFVGEPSREGKWQVSMGGGTEPAWSRNGRELFYRSGDRMMVVPVDTRRKFIAGKPDVLFEGSYEAYPLTTSYGVSPDGQRFLMVKSSIPLVDSNRIDVVLNWVAELEPRH